MDPSSQDVGLLPIPGRAPEVGLEFASQPGGRFTSPQHGGAGRHQAEAGTVTSALDEIIGQQEWLDPIDSGLQQVADVTMDRQGTAFQTLRNFLHGTWLGHPLHPVLTDVPIGAWTVAAVLDARELATGDSSLGRGADAAVTVGLVGAAGAAVTGLNDWQHTRGSARRVGILHALLNGTATSLYIASRLLRRRPERRTGLWLGLAGYAVSIGAAYLGGSLVYRERIGTDHAPHEGLSEEYMPVMDEGHLPERTPRPVEVDGVKVVLVRLEGKICALADTCAHHGGPLFEGQLEGQTIRCPWYGSRFSLATGEVLDGPSAFPQPALDARVRNGQIEVRLRREMGVPAARTL